MPDLYPFQREGVSFLRSHTRAYLADEMGLGKTVQAVVAAASVPGIETMLVVCPASAIPNWHHEAEAWGRLRPVVLSYDRLRGSSVLATATRAHGWDLVVLDEAHYCKTPSAKRTKAALAVATRARRAWLLSGTPLPNHPGELWPAVRALWPELVPDGVRTAFQWFNHFCTWRMTDYGPRATGVKNGPEFRAIVNQFMLRRKTLGVGLDLPPLRTDLFRLPPDERFADALREFGDLRDPNGLLNPLEPSVARLRRFLGEYKAPRIAELLVEELRDGAYKQIVVFAHHLSVLGRLRAAFHRAGIAVTGFDGSASQDERACAVNMFRQGNARVFLAQQTAAGVSINLQSAHEVVLVEPDWVPDQNAQAIKRVHRIGQESPCRARIFAVTGTLDEAIMGVLAQKVRIQTETIGG